MAPALVVEIEIEAGQHDGAARRPRDCRQKPCRRAVAAGRAERDDGAAHSAGLDRPHLLVDQAVAALGRVDEPRLAENLRPLLHGYVEKIEGDAPVAVEFRQHQRVELAPVDAFDDHFVDEAGELAGEMPGIERRRADEQGLARIGETLAAGVDGDDRVMDGARPGERHARALHAPPEFGCCRRQALRERRLEAAILEDEALFRRVERAERQDARQQRRRPVEIAGKGVDQGARGAARRHVDCRIGHVERAERARKSVDQAAVEQGGDECREERHAGRDREYMRLADLRIGMEICGSATRD